MTTGGGIIPLSPSEKEPYRIVATVRQLIEGRSNAVGTFTLYTGATSTTVTAVNCGPSSIVHFNPQTANAAAAYSTTFISSSNITPRQFIVTHGSTSTTDRTFSYEVRG